jgi:NADPH:quinone reductase-like Zn-dependent oxidoreductase
MRAFAFDQFDTPGSVQELPQPEPEAGQVRVRVAAGGINPADLGVIKGFYKDMMEHHFPLVPGLDFAGTVDAVGEGANGWKVGDEVFGGVGKMAWGEGTLAEYTTASTSTIAHRPDSVDVAFGAALPLAGVSALQSVEPMALKRGDVVIVLGGAGGIGGFAVQLAKGAGAHVIAVTRAANHEYAKAFGADEAVDYTTQDVYDAVSAAHPEGIAAIVHTAGDKDYLAHLSELVREGGHIASMVGGAEIEGLATRGVTGINVMTQTTGTTLEQLIDLVAAGTLKRPQIKAFSLDKAAEAYNEIGSGHVRGKLVVTP